MRKVSEKHRKSLLLAYSISGTLLHCYDLLNDFMPGEEEAAV